MHIPTRLLALSCCFAASLACAQANSTTDLAAPGRPAMKVQVLSVSQMQKEDADLLASRQAELAKAAEFNGYNVTSGTWIESQVRCSYAPNYMIMHYLKLAQDGSESLFTALVPHGKEQVRIIPVMYSGGQALKVIGTTQSQRDLINEVISSKVLSEVPNENADWVTLGYCYAALAGAEPTSQSPTTPEETTPILSLSPEGRVQEMTLTVLGPDRIYKQSRIEFDHKRQVKSIALSERTVQGPRPIPGPQSPPKGRQIPASQLPPQSRTIPASQLPSKGESIPASPLPQSPTIPASQLPPQSRTIPASQLPSKGESIPASPLPQSPTRPASPLPPQSTAIPASQLPSQSRPIPASPLPQSRTIPASQLPPQSRTIPTSQVPLQARTIPTSKLPLQSKPIPASQVPLHSKTIPAPQSPLQGRPIPASQLPPQGRVIPAAPQ